MNPAAPEPERKTRSRMRNRWQCPYCSAWSVIDPHEIKASSLELESNSDRYISVHMSSIVCKNKDCSRATLSYYVKKEITLKTKVGTTISNKIENKGRILPSSKTKIQPNYIPKAILEDYEEAYKICDLSPKASATLSRRCLQGMIRDFFDIRKPMLVHEIEAIKDKIPQDLWDAIDAVRKVGNIGAHMEKDINVIVDVDPDEAELLLNLIERLFEEWYVNRHNRQIRLQEIKQMAIKKDEAKKGISNSASSEFSDQTEEVPHIQDMLPDDMAEVRV